MKVAISEDGSDMAEAVNRALSEKPVDRIFVSYMSMVMRKYHEVNYGMASMDTAATRNLMEGTGDDFIRLFSRGIVMFSYRHFRS